MKSKWSAPFYDYYSKTIQPDVRSIVRWSIEQFNIGGHSWSDHQSSRIIEYSVERSPTVARITSRLHGTGSVLSDYKREILHGNHGMGNFHLHFQFKSVVAAVLLIEETINLHS